MKKKVLNLTYYFWFFLLLVVIPISCAFFAEGLLKLFFLKNDYLVSLFWAEKIDYGFPYYISLALSLTATVLVVIFLKKRFMSLNTLNELYSIIPHDVYLTGMNIDEFGQVNIIGVSQSMSRVFSLVTDLEDSPLFRNVKTKSTSTRKQDGKDVAAFEIGFKLEGIAKENPVEESEVGE